MKNPYEDIIHLPHPTSRKHPRMSAHDRAAQFAPFAALTGYDSSIAEAARLTDRRIELDEHSQEALNEKLSLIQEHLLDQPEITVTYFQPDRKKTGGAYVTYTGVVKKVDAVEQMLVFRNAKKISIENILDIAGEMFGSVEL